MKIRSTLFTLLFVILGAGSLLAQQQRIALAGRITDAQTSEPLPGALVVATATGVTAVAAADGAFSLQLAPDDELEVSYLGYNTITVPVANRTTITIELTKSSYQLEEVVVLGYGAEARKADLSVAATSLAIGEDIKSRSGSIMQSMQGKIAGVVITGNGGDPLSGPSVTIRGMGSRGGDTPLYVVDGVSGAPFNAEDVVSMTVLKDAASAAIYGTNVGSGGVILITTRKAAVGKPVVTVRAGYGVQSAARKPEVLTAEEYVKVRTDAARVDGVGIPSGIDPAIYPHGQTTRTDWIDEIFRTGTTQRYAVTVSGGSQMLKAYASAEYGRQQGTLINTWSENFGGKLNVDFNINRHVTLSQRVNYTYFNGQGGINTSSHTGITAAAMFMPPSATVYDIDRDGNTILDAKGNKVFGGTVPSWAKDLGVAGTFGEIVNPVASLMRLNQNRPTQNLFSTTSLVINPLEGLRLTSEFSIGTNNGRYAGFSPRVLEIGKTNDENSRTLNYWRDNRWLWESVAAYDNTFGRHTVSGMVGYSMSYSVSNSLNTTVYNFPNEDQFSQHYVNGTDWRDKPVEGRSEQSQVSVYARGAYSFDDRYFLTASIRRDASSKLYPANNWGIFPAVSGAWKISSERFFEGAADAVSLLKLRASWGQIGNVNGVRNYSYATNLAQTGRATDMIYMGRNHENPIIGLGLTSIANRNLRWETSEQTDIGFDIELARSRFSLSVDWFIKDTKDLIDEIPMPSVAGVAINPLGNVGLVRNKGWEFTLGWRDRTGGGFEYWIDGNFSTLSSEVMDMGDREFMAHTNTLRAMMPLRSTVGQPWYSYYLIPTDGIFQNEAEIQAHKVQPNAKPGDLRFVDRDGSGSINAYDADYMGSYTPDMTFGLSAGFAYRRWDFNFMLQGVAGNKIFNGVKVMTYAAGQGWNLSRDVLDAWNYDKSSSIPLISMADSNGNYSTESDFFLEEGSYCRLKNVTLGYTFPRMFSGTTSLRLYGSADNLFTITKYSGMDPEVGNRGLDGGTYPTSRVITLGVNLTF
jgi:TonB-linked SusC/RagA family outer membrane protein